MVHARRIRLRSVMTVSARSRKALITRGGDEADNSVRKAGIMSIVKEGGTVRPGDTIEARLPSGPHRPLERV
ncbi:hypothetical protein BJP40_13395 [Streptomyces sp. CC53]|nr:hypothetical protein BJP40_13395 [Streptomyces sp. CC53]